jgi:hypothetical protein
MIITRVGTIVGTIVAPRTKVEIEQVLVLGLELDIWIIVIATTVRCGCSYKLYLDNTVSSGRHDIQYC